MPRSSISSVIVAVLVVIFTVYYYPSSKEGATRKISENLNDENSRNDPDRHVDKIDPEESERVKNIMKLMVPLIDVLELAGKTEAEIREEIEVDFSTVDMHSIVSDEKLRARILLNLLKSSLDPSNIREPAEALHPSDRLKYDLKKYNNGIVALGVENFMLAATQFCEDEAADGEVDIVSVGSGDGTIEKDIIAEYRQRFGKDIRIKLVDPDPAFDGIVDFKTVDHLIEENPQVVGNCVAFIIWPLPVDKELTMYNENPYDIEAVRKLQPKAAFIVYECTGGSGSNNFRLFLNNNSIGELSREEFGMQNWMSELHEREISTDGLDNYSIIEIAHQKILLPRKGTYILRMVKLKRSN